MKSKEKKSFTIFYNTLSLGWHLRRVIEAEPDLMTNEYEWNQFVKWLERHKVKLYDNSYKNVKK